MKRMLLFGAFFSCLTLISGGVKAQNVEYDSLLAKKLHADDYGMKKYVMVLLKTGSETSLQKPVSDSLFAGHMSNMGRLVDDGKLAVAGPFFKNDKYRGIFILNAESIDEAKTLVDTDPAIKAHLLEPEFYIWYGSASLNATADIHKKIQKKAFSC